MTSRRSAGWSASDDAQAEPPTLARLWPETEDDEATLEDVIDDLDEAQR